MRPAGVAGQHHAITGRQAPSVAQRGRDAHVTLSSDLVVTGWIRNNGERAARFADVEAVPGGPAQRAQNDPVGHPSAVVDRRRTVDPGRRALGRQTRQRQRFAGQRSDTRARG